MLRHGLLAWSSVLAKPWHKAWTVGGAHGTMRGPYTGKERQTEFLVPNDIIPRFNFLNIGIVMNCPVSGLGDIYYHNRLQPFHCSLNPRPLSPGAYARVGGFKCDTVWPILKYFD